MTEMTSTSTISSDDLANSLAIVEVKPGVRFTVAQLQQMLPDAETVLFFGKVFALDYKQLSRVMALCLRSDVADELFRGSHSTDLQGYLIEGYYEHDEDCAYWGDEDEDFTGCTCSPQWHDPVVPEAKRGKVTLKPNVPHGEILPHVWESLKIEVAASITAVAAKVQNVVGMMPGKQGRMVFQQLAKVNARRPVVGDYVAGIHHDKQAQNLVVFDVSGSMSRPTVEKIVNDVVSMSYLANAHFAVVSNTTTYWEPGTYSVDDVLAAAEFSGTHYETLASVFNNDWGVVVTIADYDSSYGAKEHLAKCTGSIEQVLDISLVDRPTFLAECVGQRAQQVRPMLVAEPGRSLCRSGW